MATTKTTEATAPDHSALVGEGRAEQYEATDQTGKVYIVTRNIDTGKQHTKAKPTAEDAE